MSGTIKNALAPGRENNALFLRVIVMTVTKILGEQSGIQYQGVVDKSEADPRDSLINALFIGEFKNGPFNKPFKVTQANIRAKLGFDPDNLQYQAIQDALNTGVPFVWVMRVKGGSGNEDLPATFIWPRSTEEFNAIRQAVIAAPVDQSDWMPESWINFHSDPSVSNLIYSLHSLSLTWSYKESEYNDQLLARGVAVNKALLDKVIATYPDKNFNISPSKSLQAPLINGEIELVTGEGGSLPISALEQYVLPYAMVYQGYYLFSSDLGGWSANYGYHSIDTWLNLTGENSATEDIFLIKKALKP